LYIDTQYVVNQSTFQGMLGKSYLPQQQKVHALSFKTRYPFH